ncbi:hypothetical protein [Vibrio atlanticus]|uniref:Doubtful CDS n=1 Tax=Vibrio atlanticus (strain LGP32) TaxID=575788 RepID=B7VJ47_VIBA3|nr:hypothetical protein [Vibrio atlanticus]CAV17501.1 Doubtful CDS [Vibrio atlanticus]
MHQYKASIGSNIGGSCYKAIKDDEQDQYIDALGVVVTDIDLVLRV